MATKYRKIDPRIWRDERFVKLSEGEKLVALYCLTAQTNRCGIFVFSPAMAAEELGTSTQTFRERFKKVVLALRWQWDEDHRVLYLPTWWKYNAPENINVLAGNMKDLDDLPETPLLQPFCDNVRYLPESLRETFRERWGERYPEHPPIQEQEQEQEQEEIHAHAGGELEADKKHPPKEEPNSFARFWTAYPRKTAKQEAAKAFAKLNPDDALLDRILAALAWQSKTEDWTKERGKFIPYPASWLRGGRWEDEPPKPSLASQDRGFQPVIIFGTQLPRSEAS